MTIPKGYVEVSMDDLVEFSADDYFFKRLMEIVPPATRERETRIIKNPPIKGARIAWARLGFDV